MRVRPRINAVVLGLLAMLAPAAALAQSAPPAADTASPNAGRGRGGDITKDEYVARALERAKRAAEKRFDKIDANHDGVLTAEERRAAREERRQRRELPSQ